VNILLLGEYSGLNNELKSALICLGHDVTLAAANDFYKEYPADINLGYGSNIYSYKLRQLFLPLFKSNKFKGYDIVHVINFYTFPRSPVLNLWLVKFLKKHNNVVTLSGAGDDPFFVKYSEDTMRYSPIPSHEKYDRGRPYYMRSDYHVSVMHRYMEYVDGVIPIMFEYYSTFCAAGYSHKVCKPIPMPINCRKIDYKENIIKNNKVVFFHGLNRPGFKGTFLIEKSFDKLKRKYPNDVECIIDGKMSFDKYMKVLSNTNVSLDQVFSYSLAMNALYSMAQGKIVAGGAEEESGILYGGILPPVYNLLPDSNSLMSTLELVLENRAEIVTQSAASREFVIEYHASDSVAEKYISYWNTLLLES